MRKSLLLGNGINQCSDTNTFSMIQIKDRFREALVKNSDDIDFEDSRHLLYDLVDIIQNENSCNIEQIAAKIYEKVKASKENEVDYFSENQKQRAKRLIKKIAIQAIFISNDKFITIDIRPNVVNTIIKYERILTLNYYEYWDQSNRATYLHNRVTRSTNGNKINGYGSCVFSPILDVKKSKSEAPFFHPSIPVPLETFILWESYYYIKSWTD